MLGLGPRGVEGEHLDRAGPEARVAGRGLAERVVRLGGDRAGDARSPRRSPGRPQQPRAEPARRAQRDDRRAGARRRRELAREVEDAAHVGAAEAVDRLVGVADDDQVAAVAGQRLEQRDLAGVGVLVLVDEDVA